MTEQERAAASAENYRRMRAELDRRLSLDPGLRKLSKKIRNGKANFNDTFRYSEIVSKYLGEIMQENIGTITNPLGKEYVCKELLRDHYEAINDVLGEVQVALDEELGIHLNPVKAPRNDERIAQVAHALEDPTVKPETIRRRAKAPVVNTAMSMHDDYIRVNAKLRNDLGLKPIIQRFGTGCCSWCSAVAGKWRFGEQPEDVFRRHDNCDCVIIYDTQVLRGAKTEDGGRSKTWQEVDPGEVAAQGFQPRVLTQQQAEQLQENAVSRLTLGGRRDIMRVADSGSIYHKITDESIRNVPLVDAFGDAEKNERYREANRALLLEAAKYEPGVEVSMVYDADMKAIDGFGYVLGEMGHVRIENPGVPFHAFHNHGSGETLSFADARAFVNNSSWISVTAVGNTGSVYSLTRTAYSDSFGFGCFLRNKSRTVIFSAEGTDFTLEKIADENVSKDLKLIVSRLPAEQKKSLADAILSQTEKCLKGGAKYGFKYTEITP